jgi:hypothetical protein
VTSTHSSEASSWPCSGLRSLALEQWRDQLPSWLQRLAERPSWLWHIGIGLIISLSLLPWLLQR